MLILFCVSTRHEIERKAMSIHHAKEKLEGQEFIVFDFRCHKCPPPDSMKDYTEKRKKARILHLICIIEEER